MKIINLGRGQGKTIRLLYASEWNDIPILCAGDMHKQRLIDMAKELKLCIPEPITVSELLANRLKERRIRRIEDALVDEAPMVLQTFWKSLGMGGEVKAITLTENEDDYGKGL